MDQTNPSSPQEETSQVIIPEETSPVEPVSLDEIDDQVPRRHFLQTRTSKVVSFLIFLGTVAVAGYLLYQQPAVQKLAIKAMPILAPSAMPSPTPQGLPLAPSPTPKKEFDLSNTTDLDKRLAYLKEEKKDGKDIWIAYLMRPDGSAVEKLDIPHVYNAYKQPESSLLYYSATDSADTIFVKNLNTSETLPIQPIHHPNPEVNVGIRTEGLNGLSPDGKYLVFNVGFDMPCPPPPSGSPTPTEGGPCMPDELPELPSGMYLYDLAKQTAHVIGRGMEYRIANWDLAHHKVYLINLGYKTSGLDEVDLQTLAVRRVHNAESFGYGAYPIPFADKLAIINGTTGDSDAGPSASSISVFDQKTNQTTKFDEGVWADIQPFVNVAPDQKYFLYERTTHFSDGKAAGSIWRYDLATGEKKRLTPDTQTESFNVRGTWVDNQDYISRVNVIEPDYRSTTNYLMNLNVATGEMTRITPKNDVARFESF